MLLSRLVNTLHVAVVLAVSATAFGADNSVVLNTMADELQRNYQTLKQKADPAPYFLSYEVTEQENYSIGASLGVLNSKGGGKNRYLDVTVRVGDPKMDNFRRVRGDRIQFTSGAQVKQIDDLRGSAARAHLAGNQIAFTGRQRNG